MGLYLDEVRKLQWWSRLRGMPRAYGQARYKSSRLHVPVPARYEAHSSVASALHLSFDPCIIQAGIMACHRLMRMFSASRRRVRAC